MRRRDFIALLGGIAGSYPLASMAATNRLPVVGIVGRFTAGTSYRVPAIEQGLMDVGYLAGQNVTIENRWANGRNDQLAQIITDLVRAKAAVIITTGGSSTAMTAKQIAPFVPIVFTTGDDPVQQGLVKSLSHPGGNLTGFSLATTELMAKRLEFLKEMVPDAGTVALFVGGDAGSTAALSRVQAESAARTLGLRIIEFKIGSMNDCEAAMAAARDEGARAFVLAAAPYFARQRSTIVALAARYRLPGIYPWEEFVEEGGLMSYGPDSTAAYREVGRYAGRILDGTPPSDLPVQLPTIFKLLVNLKTATALGLTVPRLISAWADRVID